MDSGAISIRGFDPAHVKVVRKGETIFLSGSEGHHMYVVLDGQVQIEVDGRVVDRIIAGGIFGEMALVDNHPRSGTAVAVTDAKLLRMDEKEFLKLVGDSPAFALKVMRTMVERLRRANAAPEAAAG
ncbi:MAG: Crp/Fnr family transcriptional regulator [Vulcanimicrobiaceae bacterium]